jgi:hypothetical protein
MAITQGSLWVQMLASRLPNRRGDFGGVACEMLTQIAVGPAPLVLQRLWQVPMVERQVQFNAALRVRAWITRS